jgi:hypothetical protein
MAVETGALHVRPAFRVAEEPDPIAALLAGIWNFADAPRFRVSPAKFFSAKLADTISKVAAATAAARGKILGISMNASPCARVVNLNFLWPTIRVMPLLQPPSGARQLSEHDDLRSYQVRTDNRATLSVGDTIYVQRFTRFQQ